MVARNIASNLPNHLQEGRKSSGEAEEFEARLRAKRIELVTGYADALCEEIEAQLNYNAHKNEKKSNPPTFYEARDRLFAARHIVKAYHDDAVESAPLIRMVTEELKQEALDQFDSPAEAFKEWLLKEVQLYYTALKHPARVFRLCSPDTKVYTKRYALLAQVLRVCLTEGAEAAYTLWKGELGNRFDEIHGQDTSTFHELDGRRGAKTGYWDHNEAAMRPILVNDPATIKSNQEEIERESVCKAKASRFDYEVELPVEVPPKKLRGRPKGVKNKPSRNPRPLSADVAAWQAEADRKLGYESPRRGSKAS